MIKTVGIIVVAGLLVTGFLLFGVRRNAAMPERPSTQKLKSLTIAGNHKSPVKIKSVRAKGKELKSNELIVDDDDWLSGLGMDLTNGSGKTITFYEIQMFFANETDRRQPGVAWTISYGDNPFYYASDKEMPARSVKAIRPGDFIKVEMGEAERGEMQRFMKSVDGKFGNVLEIRVNLLGFSDGTAWTGQMARRDGKGSWLPMNTPTANAGRNKKRQTGAGVKAAHARPVQAGDSCGFVFPSQIGCNPVAEQCKFERENLFDELFGSDSTQPAVRPCQVTSGGATLVCAQVVSAVRADCPCGEQWDTCLMNSDCCSGFCNTGECGPSCPLNCAICIDGFCYDESPVLVDVLGNGFSLTNLSNGVNFDLNFDGTPEQLSWTAANSDDGWLVLDRNENGTIDNGRELFGNFTPQAEPESGELKNGFAALAELDKRENGGNADGYITGSDSVFSTLKIWQDTNHNGVSEPSELHTLAELGLTSVECKYKTSKRTDEFGNRFVYRAKVKDAQNTQVGRWAWDVFLLSQK
jgi:hypothetical protein